MLGLAFPALAGAWLLQYFDTRVLLAVPALGWPLATLLAWVIGGRRVAAVVLACGWTLLRAGWLIETRLPEVLAGEDVMVRGVICDFPRGDQRAQRFVLVTETDQGSPWLPARLQLSWYEQAPALAPGDRWQLRVRLRPPRGLRNPRGFDFEQWLYQRGIGASGYVRKSSLNHRLPDEGLGCATGRVRARLAARIEESIGAHPAVGYVLGVAAGATHRLTQSDWDLLRRTGATHLLAISGLHIAMVAAPFLLLAPLLGRVHAGVVPALLAAAVYTALAGFAVSTVRALVMLLAAALIGLCRRRVEGCDLLGAAALAVLALNPLQVVTVSFWLSFVAVAWLFVASTGADTACRQAPASLLAVLGCRAFAAARGLLRTQAVLGLGLAPLTLVFFGQLSLVAPLTNLVAVPVFSLLVLPLTLLGSALLVPLPVAGGALLAAAAAVIDALLAFLRIAAATPTAMWQPLKVDTPGLAMLGAAALMLCWWRPLPLRSPALFLLLPVLAGVSAEPPLLQVTVLDVGQGLSVIVQTRHRALLYDTGPAFRLSDAGQAIVVPALREAGVRRLDAMVVSHDDQDHSGGASSVLQAHPDVTLIAPRGTRLVARRQRRCMAGVSWEWDGVRFSLAAPAPLAPPRSDNDNSCVLRVSAPGFSILLPGDIGRRREEALVTAGLIGAADVVVAPHHGSRTSSGRALVGATRPRLAVFSAGHRNRWGFPAPEIRRRWAQGGACILETATTGAIVLVAADRGTPVIRRRERIDGAHLWSAGDRAGSVCPGVTGDESSAGVG